MLMQEGTVDVRRSVRANVILSFLTQDLFCVFSFVVPAPDTFGQ